MNNMHNAYGKYKTTFESRLYVLCIGIDIIAKLRHISARWYIIYIIDINQIIYCNMIGKFLYSFTFLNIFRYLLLINFIFKLFIYKSVLYDMLIYIMLY